jgi:glucan phosphorylase
MGTSVSPWIEAKRSNKVRLAQWVKKNMGIQLNVDALFDMQAVAYTRSL